MQKRSFDSLPFLIESEDLDSGDESGLWATDDTRSHRAFVRQCLAWGWFCLLDFFCFLKALPKGLAGICFCLILAFSNKTKLGVG